MICKQNKQASSTKEEEAKLVGKNWHLLHGQEECQFKVQSKGKPQWSGLIENDAVRGRAVVVLQMM